jgi:hypothetical protein
MRKRRIVMVALSFLAHQSPAQVPSVKEDTARQPKPSVDHWLEVVHNQGSSSLEGFLRSSHARRAAVR